jgi:S-adenosyl-L-methionine hydrolase (adenosine-forming)
MPVPVITLTTDFGQADGYVAAVKGVILTICPQATLVDVSHEIRPQAVAQAAYLLLAVAPYFPPGTVHLVVVDPGVGTQRRAVAVETGRAIYVAPDNGVLSLALAGDKARAAVELTEPRYRLAEVSATFHGRDIFAPAAAHLAGGRSLTEMGPSLPVAALQSLPPARQPEVIHVDRFGNLITNYRVPAGETRLAVTVGGARLEGLVRTFADVEPGALLAYRGSSGYLEIAVREGSAAQALGLGSGAAVKVQLLQ